MFRRKPPRIHDLEMSFIKCVVLLLVVGFFDHAGTFFHTPFCFVKFGPNIIKLSVLWTVLAAV